MKKDIHPWYEKCAVACACGNVRNPVDKRRDQGRSLFVLPPFYTGRKGRGSCRGRQARKFQRKYEGVDYGQRKLPNRKIRLAGSFSECLFSAGAAS